VIPAQRMQCTSSDAETLSFIQEANEQARAALQALLSRLRSRDKQAKRRPLESSEARL